jgi:hypothetical protein
MEQQCKQCQETKAIDEFYTYSSNGKPMKVCKSCHKQRSTKTKPGQGHEHERILVERLHQQGIFATLGFGKGFNFADVVAWGCVRVEAKLGEKQKNGSYLFRFTGKQIKQRVVADIIILIFPYSNGWSYHLFDANDPIFFLADGKRKTGVSYLANAHHRKMRANTVFPFHMGAAKDNWQIIEEYRLRTVQRLMANMITPEPIKTPVVKQLTLL